MTIKHGAFIAALIVGAAVGASATFIFINKNGTADASTYAVETDLGGGKCKHVDYDQATGAVAGGYTGTWNSKGQCSPAIMPHNTNSNTILPKDAVQTTGMKSASVFTSSLIELSSTNVSAVAFVQGALIKGKYLTAKPTGKFDAATVTALRAFQKAKGLKITGTMTLETISALDAIGK